MLRKVLVWGLHTWVDNSVRSSGLLEKDQVWGKGLEPGGFEVSLRHVSSEWSSKTLRSQRVGDKNQGLIGVQMERETTDEDALVLGESIP